MRKLPTIPAAGLGSAAAVQRHDGIPHAEFEQPDAAPVTGLQALYTNLELAVERVPIESLKTYKRQLRKHSKDQIEKLRASICAFGMVQPLLVDGTGELIGGQGLLQAARLAGYTKVPIVRLAHLDEAQKRALRIALNRLAELSKWDDALLALEFKELIEIDLELDLCFDLAITGFATAEIDKLVEMDSSCAHEDDAVPDGPAGPPVSRLGDIFELGDHRIICGDAREPAVYRALLGSERASVGIHDAPYNVAVNGHVSKAGRHDEFLMASGEMSEAQFMRFLATFLIQARAFSHPGAVQFAFMDWRHIGEMLSAGREAGLALKNLCVWNKGAGALGSLYRSQHELTFVFADPNGKQINNVQLGKHGRNRTNVWDFPGAPSLRKELELHPTPKPVQLVAEAIRDCSNRNDLVLDSFSGSGTTIIAAAKSGRRARVIELSPHYVDVAVRRWEEWSGTPARHSGNGATFEELASKRSAPSGEQQRLSVIDCPPAPRVRVRQRPKTA
jgi:hypothetical protein